MSTVVIGNIPLIDLRKKDNAGLKLYKLAKPHVDDDFPDFIVPKDFITNGATVPKFLRDIISPTGEIFRAAVVHDFLYSNHSNEFRVSRKRADRIFYKIILDDTGNHLLAWLAWLAVRLFGGDYWKKDKVNV